MDNALDDDALLDDALDEIFSQHGPINILPPEILSLILQRLPLLDLIPLHPTSKLWTIAIQKLELTTRLMQEKFFFYNKEFIQVGTDEIDVNWTKVFNTRKKLPQLKRYTSLPLLVDASQLTEEQMGSGFPTIGPNIGIYSGSYYYEVKLLNGESLFIGWMSLDEKMDGSQGFIFFFAIMLLLFFEKKTLFLLVRFCIDYFR